MSDRNNVRAGLVWIAALVLAAPLAAQLPDSFENLEVLSKDIGQRELIEVMKGFSGALGVRCQHCHVGEEGKPLSDFDFVSDERPAKDAARVMIRMTEKINNGFERRRQGAGGGELQEGSRAESAKSDGPAAFETARGRLAGGTPALPAELLEASLAGLV